MKDISVIDKPTKPELRTFKPGDVTGYRMQKFFECKDIGSEPEINATGFWKKPVHGITVGKKRRSSKNGSS